MAVINNYELSSIIMHELIRLGIRDSYFNFNGQFSEKELSHVTKLNLQGIVSLADIDKLPNLLELNIYSYPSSNLIEFEKMKINSISDFHILEKLTKLEVLRIVNDNFLECLDVSQLKNLKTLWLFNNTKLQRIKGLSSLNGLEEVCICGNNICSIDDIEQYIINTSDIACNVLDIKLFGSMFLKNEELRRFLEDKLNQAMSNIKFGEKITFDNNLIVFSYDQVKNMYLRASRILKHIGVEEVNMETIKRIHAYIAYSLKYDSEGLKYRDDIYGALALSKGAKKEYLLNRLKLINSSYAALVNKKAVCEGYVNMMIVFLQMIGIEAHMVNCCYGDDVSFNHAAVKFKYGDTWYYADPERERLTKDIDLFGMTFKEFTKLYHVPIKEYIDNEMERGRRKCK